MPPGSTVRSQAAVCLLYLLFPGVLSRTNEAKRSFAESSLPSFLSRKLAVGKAEPYDLKAKRSFAGKRPGKQRPLAAPFPAGPLREQTALPNQRYNQTHTGPDLPGLLLFPFPPRGI